MARPFLKFFATHLQLVQTGIPVAASSAFRIQPVSAVVEESEKEFQVQIHVFLEHELRP